MEEIWDYFVASSRGKDGHVASDADDQDTFIHTKSLAPYGINKTLGFLLLPQVCTASVDPILLNPSLVFPVAVYL
jgi:hypothetical protein